MDKMDKTQEKGVGNCYYGIKLVAVTSVGYYHYFQSCCDFQLINIMKCTDSRTTLRD